MTWEIIFVLALLLGAVILFVTERLSVDLVALIIMSVLLLSGIITPAEGIAGFSNMATVTVGAMFILSAGLFKTGAVNFVGGSLSRVAKRNYWFALATIMVASGAVSAFINNTAAVAIFMPILLGVARDMKLSPSKLLMPLSFASMFGGVCTLIGTSTNILVSSIAEQHGQPQFGMFEFLPLGGVMFAVGLLYMMLVGVRLIPSRRTGSDLTQNFAMGDYLTDIVVLPQSDSVGKPLAQTPIVCDLNITVLEILRNGDRKPIPSPQTIIEAGDVLRVRANVEKIRALQERAGVQLKPGAKWREEDFASADAVLVEAVVALNTGLDGMTLKDLRFRNTFGATVLAIRHRGQILREKVGSTPLRGGDALLIEVRRDRLEQLKQNGAFVLVSEVGLPEFRYKKMLPAALIVGGVVAAAALNILPIVVSAIVGCVLLVLSGCITLEEAYRSIEWRIIFLLAGVLTLGIALEKTGAARLISASMISTIGIWGPVALVSGLFFLTMMLTNVMSNNASAALLAPIAIATAQSIGANPRPFLMAVTFAASLSFMTPVGYQTNTLIYGPGQYKFADFLRVGTPLTIIFWLLATFLIPYIWPF